MYLFRTSLAVLLLFVAAGVCASENAHHGHAAAGGAPAVDALGRQLYDMPHAMDSASYAELRKNVPKFAGLDDQRIMEYMHLMGPDYTWYLSPRELSGRRGVLILGHGYRDKGDRDLHDRLQPFAAGTPAALALGMSMTGSAHIRLALDDLVAAGAQEIVVVPLVSTRYNSMFRQWAWIFGQADAPAYAAAPQVSSDVTLRFVEPFDDHAVVAEVLADRAREISRDPAREELFVIAHGPETAAENEAQLAMLEQTAAAVAAEFGFADAHVHTLQDDAPPEVRRANVTALRTQVQAVADRGRSALVVTSLLSSRVVQSQLRRDLRGLSYRFNFRGLMDHDAFLRWIQTSIDEAGDGWSMAGNAGLPD